MNPRPSRSATSLLWAVGLVAAVAFEATAAERTGSASDQDRLVGVFTGRFLDGVPIYRFQSVTVVADRKTELVKTGGQSPCARVVSREARPSAVGAVPQPGGMQLRQAKP